MKSGKNNSKIYRIHYEDGSIRSMDSAEFYVWFHFYNYKTYRSEGNDIYVTE